MPLFRPGKPWALLTVTSPKTQTAGAQGIAWDVLEGDGELDWPNPDSTGVAIEIPGLYLITLAVGRDAIAVSSEATARITIDGTVRAGTRSPASTTQITMSCSHVRQLTAGQIVSTSVQLSSGATAGFFEAATSLGITRIGPVRWT